MEFVLTTDHPAYEPPLPGQQHCYRSGLLVLEKPTVVDLLPVQLNKYAVTLDLDGTFDLGSLELYRLAPRRFRMLTQWFDMTVDVESLTLRLKGSIPLTA